MFAFSFFPMLFFPFVRVSFFILILGNKKDSPKAVGEEELKNSLGIATGRDNVKEAPPLQLLMSSCLSREGCLNGFFLHLSIFFQAE